jgi:hypothetical protein
MSLPFFKFLRPKFISLTYQNAKYALMADWVSLNCVRSIYICLLRLLQLLSTQHSFIGRHSSSATCFGSVLNHCRYNIFCKDHMYIA